MNADFETTAAEFLKSEQGKKVKRFAASAEGQKLRTQYAAEGEKLREAVKSGDMASAEALLKSFLSSSDGQKLAAQIQHLVK